MSSPLQERKLQSPSSVLATVESFSIVLPYQIKPFSHTVSLSQYPHTCSGVQIRRSGGVTSMSMFVHFPSGAKEDVSLGSTQPETWRFAFKDSLAACARVEILSL